MAKWFIKSFNKTVSSAGTPVQLQSSTFKVRGVTITANPNNSGTIWVSDSNVDALSSPPIGQPLAGNESMPLEPPVYTGTDDSIDLSKIYVDATANGDIVHVTYYVREQD